MTKKILFSIAMIALAIGVFAVAEPVKAAPIDMWSAITGPEYHTDNGFYVNVYFEYVVERCSNETSTAPNCFNLADIVVGNGNATQMWPAVNVDSDYYEVYIEPNVGVDVNVWIEEETVEDVVGCVFGSYNDDSCGAADGEHDNELSNILTVPFQYISYNDLWTSFWSNKYLDTPYFNDNVDLKYNDPLGDKMGSNSLVSFGENQLHAVEDTVYTDFCGEEVVSYVRFRVQAYAPDILEGAFAAKIWLDKTGKPEVAAGVSNAAGVIDIVAKIPAGATYGITLANVGAYDVSSYTFETWVTQGDEPGGGVIMDFRNDDSWWSDAKGIQFSTMEEAIWEFDPFTFTYTSYPNSQYWMDIPTGTYNVGIEDTVYKYVWYKDSVVVKDKAFFKWTPDKNASIWVEIDIDGSPVDELGIDYEWETYFNVVDGFLFDDLSAGNLYGNADAWVRIAPGFDWDFAAFYDGSHYDFFVVSLSFNPVAGDLNIVLDEMQYIQPAADKDWDEAWLWVTPPGGNLNLRKIDFGQQTKDTTKYNNQSTLDRFRIGDYGFGGYPIDKYHNAESVLLFAQAGCCGEVGPFTTAVELIEDEKALDCCGQPDIDLIDCDCETCAGSVGCCPQDVIPNWWYYFEPTISEWGFELTEIEDLEHCGYLCLEPSYAPIFGDGPWTTDAGTSMLEYDVSMLGGEVLLERGLWSDKFGNTLFRMLTEEECVNLCYEECEFCNELDNIWAFPKVDKYPLYALQENVTGEITVLAEGWETTSLGPITEIGRWRFWAILNHGYLGEIVGFPSSFVEVDCTTPIPCGETCLLDLTDCVDCCEIADRQALDLNLFAISPADVRMNSEWGWSWVMALYEMDLTNGVTTTTYAPDMDVTRAEVAAFLGRLMKAQGLTLLGTATQFIDVPATHWAAQDILMLRDYGIVIGRDDDRFYPLDPVTRAEMTKMIQQTFRTLKNYGAWAAWWDVNWNIIPSGEIFADVPEGEWYTKYVEESYADLLVDGRYSIGDDKFFVPNGFVTRQEMAKFLVRAIQVDDDTQGFWPSLAAEK